MNKTTKALISLAVNFLLLIIPYVVIIKLDTFSPTLKPVFRYGVYAVFALCMFFALWFNRSRIFFTVLTLALSHFVLSDLTISGMEGDFYRHAVFTAASLVIPLNILIFSILKERGILSSWGRMRFTVIAAEMLIFSWIVWYGDIDLLQLLDVRIFPFNSGVFSDFSHLSILLFFMVTAYLVLRQAVTGNNHDSPFTASVIFSFAALLLRNRPYAAAVLFSASGLLLLAVVIHASYTMAYLDELTGLPSRRALKEEMQKLGGRYAVAMLDIDHFKQFNDTHGHDVGDDVLKLVAACIKGVGGGGRAFRYGGEEFTILFPGKSADEVVPYLEELREYIANRGFIKRSKGRPKKRPKEIVPKAGGYKKLYLTVSMGVAEKDEKHRTAEEVAVAADKALYRAKSKGRNCVSK